MKLSDRNVVRLAVVQHIRAFFGIKLKNWNKKSRASSSFLVDACTSLKEHIHTEGLFRKSGSVIRLKALRAKLDQGEDCISSALPCDLAGLLKQFFRDLPDPILPTELQEAMLKAQQLPAAEDRASALQLLSCVLPDRNSHTLRYFFNFLKDVSQRCEENKMDSSNLSVIFAPNLLHNEGTEKMSASTERRLKLQAAVVHFYIENAQEFGVVPQFILEKIPGMVGCEMDLVSPLPCTVEDGETDSGVKKRQRRSLGDVVNGALHKLKSNRTPTNTPHSDGYATPVMLTPNAKRKLPPESGHSYGFSNKKKKSIKKNLGLELLPNSLFSSSSTPGSECLSGKDQEAICYLCKEKEQENEWKTCLQVRVESGKAGCFSPKVTKKDAVRKSLRLRFSLGKSSRDPNVISHSLLGPKGSEAIGWRLATQDITTSFVFSKETPFSPAVLRDKNASNRPKHISKSEDNLLTPQCDSAAHQTSWNGACPNGTKPFGSDAYLGTPVGMSFKNNYFSEPTLGPGKLPNAGNTPKHLCCVTSAESLHSDSSIIEDSTLTGSTLLKVKNAFAESSSNLCLIIKDHSAPTAKEMRSEVIDTVLLQESPLKPEVKQIFKSPSQRESQIHDQNITLNQLEITPLTPLHIDSALFEVQPLADSSEEEDILLQSGNEAVACMPDQLNCSRLVEALDIGSPLPFKQTMSINVQSKQSTPCRSNLQVSEQLGQMGKAAKSPAPKAHLSNSSNVLGTLESRLRVADHIKWFNTLTLDSPKTKAVRSPLKFQRIPVRQSVRRINSLLASKASGGPTKPASPIVKSLSLETGLLAAGAGPMVTCLENEAKGPCEVAPRRFGSTSQQVRHCVLDDVTNKVHQKMKGDPSLTGKGNTTSYVGISEKLLLRQASAKDTCHYKGSPKNPLAECRLLSAMKPIDL
ncbi:rho GTPase-activating protein 11A-like [Scleropages formosus]|uniref:Rho GTPase-activating protein 11A-like n=1 Tax=Scleropages formosus TaxID=113540 RepID=A0A0P7V326_SCLFO|nr:rho GTPase-activating protein 11A-like [Scleropages formosus]